MSNFRLQIDPELPRLRNQVHSPPGSWPELVMVLIQEYPVRFAGAILIGILGVTLDVGCESDYIPPPEPRSAGGAAATALVGAEPAPPEPPPPVDPDTLRFEFGELPGTGHAGVTKLLERYGVTRDAPETEREFAAHVRTALGGADPGQRLGAVRVLTRLGPAAGADVLVGLSRDPEEEIRLTALRGLGRMRGDGVPPAVERLREVGSDPDAGREERFQAIQSLSRIRVRVDVDFVAEVATRESDPLLRLIAARTLLAHRDERAVGVLLELVAIGSSEYSTPEELAFIRREANDALREVAPTRPTTETAGGWRQVLPSIFAALASEDFAYVPRTLYPPR